MADSPLYSQETGRRSSDAAIGAIQQALYNLERDISKVEESIKEIEKDNKVRDKFINRAIGYSMAAAFVISILSHKVTALH